MTWCVFCAGPVIDKRVVSCVSKLEQTHWLDALRKQANYGAKKSPKPQRLQVSRNKMYLMFCCTTELYLHVCGIWFYYVCGKALVNDSFNILIAYCTKAECFVTLHIHFTPNWIECGQLGSAVVPCFLHAGRMWCLTEQVKTNMLTDDVLTHNYDAYMYIPCPASVV